MKRLKELLKDGVMFFYSVLFWLLGIYFTATFSLFGITFMYPISLFLDPKSGLLMHYVARFWGMSIVYTSPIWRMRVVGRENVMPHKTYLIISNHQSILDILVVLAGVPTHFKFLSKKEVFPIPLIGWFMTFARYIPVDRSSGESKKKAVLKASEWLRSGVSVLFFPEGTRSRDGHIQPFKIGAFKLARETNVEILPVVIEGTGKVLPRNSWKAKKVGKFVLSIGKPIPVSVFKTSPIEQVRDSIHREMCERLMDIRAGND